MTQRTNTEWLSDLAAYDTPQQADALEALRVRLSRGIFYYLRHERSDLASVASQELDQMAADFAQEALLRILDNMASFRGDSQFTTWATKVAVRVAISELRRARYRDFSLEAISADGDLMPAMQPDFGSQPSPDPEKAAERRDALEKVQHALATALTERQRGALEAVGVRGTPMDIVAAQMNTNRNALYKLLHDARMKLRAALEAQGLSVAYYRDLFE